MIDKFKSFSEKVNQKINKLIAGTKELKDSAKAKMYGYDKAINEKFGEALNTKLFTFEEKKALVNFITQSSIKTDKDLDTVISYQTNALRNALLKALPGKITDETDKQAFEKLKQHGGGAYENNIWKFDALNRTPTSDHGDIKETTLELCNLYKKYVDPSAFPEVKEDKNDGVDTSDLSPNELDMLNYLKKLAPDPANENLKIFAKILIVGSKLIDYFPTDNPAPLVKTIEGMINQRITNMNLNPKQAEEFKTEQLTKAYQIIKENPELTYIEFKTECNEQIVQGSSGFEIGLKNLENDPTLTHEEKQDIRNQIDATSTEHKTEALYHLMNSKILEKYGFDLYSNKGSKLQVKYKNQAIYFISYKANEFGGKNLYANLKNANNLQTVCSILGFQKDEIESKTLENFADDTQKIKNTSRNNPKSDVKTSKIQSHKPTEDKVPVKSQTTVQTTTPNAPPNSEFNSRTNKAKR